MVDNSSLPVASGNETFANDDIGGVKYPRPKINWGPDGTANDVDVASGKPLPVQVRGSDGTDNSNNLSARRWVAGSGVGLTWTTIFSTTLNSLANGNALLQAADINNDTALDKYMDVSVHLDSAAFTGTGINFSIHLYPLNDDGTTYGDGRFTSAAAGPANYLVGSVPLIAATQAQNGTVTGILIPPGKFRLVVGNNGGVALAASGNTVKYRTYN